ncbi:asparagine synthase (glutamine-hydrolyzing) [Capnocytophaga canis]|uniref:asparagine synthase (glutamine-hydrolyzing) n=1 Tax=Capnocytophaga canis TaxID=1848903 RepID=UPI00370D76C7
MSGIKGLIYKKADLLSKQHSEEMNLKIIHPKHDEHRIFVEEKEKHTYPVHLEEQSKVLTFDGRIYNYSSLRKKLENQGYRFKNKSDTELILYLYQEYGNQCFKMLDGMFAIALYDKNNDKVFIARDFFGNKSLYYTQTQNGFVWSLELKETISTLSQKPKIDKIGLNLYFQLTYIPAPFTIYEGVKKLEANSLLIYDLKADTYYIEPIHTDKVQKQNIDFYSAKKKVKDLVTESVLAMSVSDVPLGTFLSGGVDSSIVNLCLAQNTDQKINTFSIGFDKKSFDETEKSRMVAQLIGSEHNEFVISQKDLTQHLDAILLNFDQPFADSSALPSYMVAKKTSDFVKVALTGDGGDEVFGGYNKYRIGAINHKYTSIVPQFFHNGIVNISNVFTKQREDHRGLKFKIRKALQSINYDGEFFYNIIKLGFPEHELDRYMLSSYFTENPLKYYKSQLPKPQSLSDFRQVDKMLSLEGDMIVKVDRTSMLASLECRAPLLTHALWNYTHSLPDHFLLKGNDKKRILKKAFEDQFPEGFLEKSKQGFGVPVGDWLKQGLKDELLSYIEDGFLEKQNIFNVTEIKRIVLNHVQSKEDNSFRVWTFYCFQKWYKNIYDL